MPFSGLPTCLENSGVWGQRPQEGSGQPLRLPPFEGSRLCLIACNPRHSGEVSWFLGCHDRKVEVRIPAQAPFSKEFGILYCAIRNDPKVDPFRSSRHYLYAGDLRAFGHEAILHMSCVRDKQGNHKIELLDTGTKSYGEMREEIERIFRLDARRLPLMRVDLAADVQVFPSPVRAPCAGALETMGMRYLLSRSRYIGVRAHGEARGHYFYLGKRPNVFRIYDKLAEYHHQYAQLMCRASDAAEVPSFEEAYGRKAA